MAGNNLIVWSILFFSFLGIIPFKGSPPKPMRSLNARRAIIITVLFDDWKYLLD